MTRKCLYPAVGYGTRFLPATEGMVRACHFGGRRFDCGSLEGCVEATFFLCNKPQQRN